MSNLTERRVVNRRTEDIYRKAIEDIRDYAIFMIAAERCWPDFKHICPSLLSQTIWLR